MLWIKNKILTLTAHELRNIERKEIVLFCTKKKQIKRKQGEEKKTKKVIILTCFSVARVLYP